MSEICHIDDIAYVNKILTDCLTAASGQKVESMDYYSCNINDFDKNIDQGVIIIFQDEKPVKIEYCDHVKDSINNFTNKNPNIKNIGVGIIYNIKNIYSQQRALKMIENYLGLIFKL